MFRHIDSNPVSTINDEKDSEGQQNAITEELDIVDSKYWMKFDVTLILNWLVFEIIAAVRLFVIRDTITIVVRLSAYTLKFRYLGRYLPKFEIQPQVYLAT